MITEFTVKNFKSIQELTLPLGRVNVLIGENGSGKSNVLEALGLMAAAMENKLDNTALSARGIRVTSPPLMRAGFLKENSSQNIDLKLTNEFKKSVTFRLTNDNQTYSKWMTRSITPGDEADLMGWQPNKLGLEEIKSTILEAIKNSNGTKEDKEKILADIENSYPILRENISLVIPSFSIFSLENSALRLFEKEGQLEPLGINGEGLFKLIKYFGTKPGALELNELRQHLQLFGWFEDIDIPPSLFEAENYLQIRDRYLAKGIGHFDQRSVNEGFLFVLFYFCLLISDLAPRFFAIDNLEASLNPKLCTKLMRSLVELAKKSDKQMVITTHSPAVLDGLDLSDDEQRLFLVYRNADGHTKLKRLTKPQPLPGQDPVKLSEAFARGYLGGLPKNFAL
jgi:predicted ATPase